MLAFGQSFEFGVSGGMSTTSNPNVKFNTFSYQKESLSGGVFAPAVSAQALFNMNGLFQTGIVADYYGLKAWHVDGYGSEGKYKLAKAQLNIMVELNAMTGGDKAYFYMGGAAGLDNGGQYVWGAQTGFMYKPQKHIGVFFQGSMRKINIQMANKQEVGIFTFPITIGARVLI